jgi:hypothetical protein
MDGPTVSKAWWSAFVVAGLVAAAAFSGIGLAVARGMSDASHERAVGLLRAEVAKVARARSDIESRLADLQAQDAALTNRQIAVYRQGVDSNRPGWLNRQVDKLTQEREVVLHEQQWLGPVLSGLVSKVDALLARIGQIEGLPAGSW